MNTFLLTVAYGELLLWLAALHLLFFHTGRTFAESASYALITTLMIFSFVFQISFLTGAPKIGFLLEAVVSAVALMTVWRLRACFISFYQIVRFAITRYPFALLALGAILGYLAFRAASAAPVGDVEIFFNTIENYRKHHSFFAASNLPEQQALLPVNSTILLHLFLRGGSQVGTGLIGFLAYLSVGFSTYALSRRYAWPDTAITVTFITLSLTRLVFLATTPGMELVPAATSLFCILAIYRVLEEPEIGDLTLLLLGILFSIAGHLLCLAFPAILTLLACVLLVRRHGRVTWTSLWIRHWKVSLAALVPMIVFSQIWLFGYNIMEYGGWLGFPSESNAPVRANMLLGTVANLVRYGFESLHLAHPFDLLGVRFLDFSFNAGLEKIYNLLFWPLWGASGAATPFSLTWTPGGQMAWFGPFGILFVVPAVLISILRAHRRLKAIAVALAGYVYVVILVVDWMPGNAQYFTMVFVCGGFGISFLLPPWRITSAGKTFLQVCSILLLAYACFMSTSCQPLVLFDYFQF